MRKKEKDLIEVLEKMQTYVALAEQEIATRKIQCQLLELEDKLDTSSTINTISTVQITWDRGNSGPPTTSETSVTVTVQDAEERVRRDNWRVHGD